MVPRDRAGVVVTDYSVEIKIRNGRILRLMRAAGFPNANQLAAAAKVGPEQIGQYINLKKIPINERGEWRSPVERMAQALGCSPEDMFSEEQRTSFMASNKRYLDIGQAEVNAMLEVSERRIESPEEKVGRIEMAEHLSAELHKLRPREREVLIRHYGLNGPEETFAAIAKDFGLSLERTRQIEAKAIRRLKHPEYSRNLRPFVE